MQVLAIIYQEIMNIEDILLFTNAKECGWEMGAPVLDYLFKINYMGTSLFSQM